jgi:hypothetical protein
MTLYAGDEFYDDDVTSGLTIGPIQHSPSFCHLRSTDENGAIVCKCWCANCERGWHPDDCAHEWERGVHMAEAFGIDGRKFACAICGVPKPRQKATA